MSASCVNPDVSLLPPSRQRPTTGLFRRVRNLPLGTITLWVVLLVLIVIPVLSFVATAISPALFGTGSQWFTFSNIAAAFSGSTGQGVVNSLWVSITVGVLAVVAATTVAWLVQRTNVPGRRLFTVAMWLLLLVPTWMTTLGWLDVIQPGELGTFLGLPLSWSAWISGQFFGPTGIIFVLSTAALPFSYFVISAGLRGLGPEFEDAARVHGASRMQAIVAVLPIIAPALLSAFAISFAEAISDFGVAFTLGSNAHFPIATFTMFNAIYSFPANFPVAAVIAGVLILCTIPPVLLQAKITRGRSYAVLSGRTKAPRRHEFGVLGKVVACGGLSVFFLFVLGLPLLGAVSSSFTATVSFYTTTGVHWTLKSFHEVFTPPPSFTPLGPALGVSNQLGFYVATGTVIISLALAKRLAAKRRGASERALDVFLLGSVAVPGIVLGIGYIFFFDQQFITNNFANLYETTTLFVMALIASAIPGQSRLLAGPVAQIQSSMSEAARVHGAGRVRTWWTTSLPVLSRAMVWAWLLSFTKTIAELAIAQILYVPGKEPASVVIETYLGTIFAPVGAAATVLTLGEMLGVIIVVLTVFRLVTPKGWRRIGTVGIEAS